MSDEDVALVERSLSGDRSAFAGLVARHVPWASCVVAASLDAQAVEGVVHAAFHRAWRSLGSLRQTSAFAPWFLDLVRREIQAHGHAHPDQVLRPGPPGADEWMMPEESEQAALLSLELSDREMMVMVEEGRQSYAMLSEIYGLSGAACERRLLAARKRFWAALKRRKQAAHALA